MSYITLDEAKDHLGIDAGLTVHDARVQNCLDGAIDAAENYTQRSLGELLVLNSPRDSAAVALPDPKDSPAPIDVSFLDSAATWGAGYDWSIGAEQWSSDQYQTYWAAYLAANPFLQDHSQPLRRDVKQAVLLQMEMMFDRNVANYDDLQNAFERLLFPYRIGFGV